MKVVISKGDKTSTVTKTAFDNYFKNNGWEIVGNSTIDQPIIDNTDVSKVEDEWDSVLDDIEKPLSEMSRSELIDFATSKGIEIPNDMKTRQLREFIEANI